MKPTVLIACLLLAACVELESESGSEPVEPTTDPALATGGAGGGGTGGTGDTGDTLGGKETNGRWLIGVLLDGIDDGTYHLSVTSVAVARTGETVPLRFDGNASLVGTWSGAQHSGADVAFKDMRFTTVPSPGELEIFSVRDGGSIMMYRIRYRATGLSPWTDPCSGGEAVVTAGRWTLTGDHVLNTTHFTFTCAGDGAAAKCAEQGYLPGAISEQTLGWRSHQACTRALRADICGNGEHHTRDGTRLMVYDRAGVHATPPESYPPVTDWPPPYDEYHFDGGWGVDGMVCGGKARWASLSIGNDCPGTLHDPRTDPTGRLCDDGEPLTDTRIIVETTATFNELPLHQWKKGNDRVVTVRGYHSLTGDEMPPYTGYEYVGPDDSYLLRTVPTSVSASELIQVNMYAAANGDHVVAAAPPTANHIYQGTEGWVFNWNRGGTIGFRGFTGPAGDRLTSTKASPASGYAPGTGVGNTIAP